MSSVPIADTLAPKPPMNRWKKLLLAMAVIYASLFAVSRLVIHYFFPEHTHVQMPYTGNDSLVFSVIFFAFFTPLLYAFGCFLAGQILKPQWRRLTLYMGATFMGGAIGEILIGHLGEWLLQRKVWYYQIAPEHGGHTTGVGAIMWPMYGFYLYFFHEAMKLRGVEPLENVLYSGTLIAIDAMVLETLANIFSLATFNIYYFYYVSADLLHFSSAEIFLPYVAFGIFGSLLLKWLDNPKLPRASLGLMLYFVGLFLVFILKF